MMCKLRRSRQTTHVNIVIEGVGKNLNTFFCNMIEAKREAMDLEPDLDSAFFDKKWYFAIECG